MILQSLVDYYEILAAAGEISKPGYCKAKVSYALNISQDGELLGVIPLKIEVPRGKKMVEVPQLLEVPEQQKKTVGIVSNFLCENSAYILGIDNKGKPERTKQCFEAFKILHHEVLDGVDCGQAKAVLSFLDDWQPQSVENCTVITDYLEALTSGANITFNILGLGFAQDSTEIKQAWEKYRESKPDSVEMQCLVTGDIQPIARLHPSIKGVIGAQSMGASIVSFNAKAYESYGRDDQQGLNAPVSEHATFAYTTVLNYLLSNREYKQSFGDTTVVYWAKSPKKIYQNLFAHTLNPTEASDEISVDKESEGLIKSVFNNLVQGKPVGNVESAFDKDTKFYILGLAPNAARLSVRFFIENSFGNILDKVAQHYRDLEIEKSPNEFEYLPLWKLMSETASPKSKDKASSPLLSGSVLRSIFSGSPYPQALYNSVMVRIRAERDITRGKAAIIKACLLRNKNENYKEELTVSLNEHSKNSAYILGRLFAVLEKAQQDANPGINATIKDRYFTSACATPASVFPILLRLSNHHISKAKYGYVNDRRISDLMGKLDVDNNPFPAHLSLEEQGIFILGYYHQQKANYVKNEKEENLNVRDN
ncbi:MAG TPA: type I-C CRISPR-associated protein Cas8c/Csd1 [Clostridia bacterium]|nr:type I-C CRISPR-associated protein Cas8c/Csd1 [Clostridia bacterium]